jgi:hypothetical protein
MGVVHVVCLVVVCCDRLSKASLYFFNVFKYKGDEMKDDVFHRMAKLDTDYVSL